MAARTLAGLSLLEVGLWEPIQASFCLNVVFLLSHPSLSWPSPTPTSPFPVTFLVGFFLPSFLPPSLLSFLPGSHYKAQDRLNVQAPVHSVSQPLECWDHRAKTFFSYKRVLERCRLDLCNEHFSASVPQKHIIAVLVRASKVSHSDTWQLLS